jgi:hypothetical protein
MQTELKATAGSRERQTDSGAWAPTGDDSGLGQGTGPKAKGRSVVFRTFDGLVQQRMERMFGAATHSFQADAPARLNPFQSFGD